MNFLLERFASRPEELAFVGERKPVTYGELLQIVEAQRKWLAETPIRPGEVVAFTADFSPEIYALMLALAERGNILVPLTRETRSEHGPALQIAQARYLLDPPRRSWQRLEHRQDHPLLEELQASGRPGLILFTSGSTGTPKAILHDFSRVAEKFRQARQASVAITFLSLDHFGGINTLLAITSSLGTVVTVAERTVTAICQAIQQHRVETLPTTPSFLNLLVHSGGHLRYDLSSLRLVTYGTEVMSATTLARLQRIFPGVRLQQTYGLSELGVLRSRSREDGSLWVRLGGEGFATRVVDGVLWIRSDFAMLGYLNAPSPFDQQGWFNTEDRVEVDGEYFRILGRVTGLINVGGEKVYPAEIEEVILELDNIVDVSVHGESHALIGQMIVARVVLQRPEPLPQVKARIRKACAARLAAFKWPSKVVLAEDGLYSSRMKKIRSTSG